MSKLKGLFTLLLFISISKNCLAQYDEAKLNAEQTIQSLLEIYPSLSIAVGVGDEVIWSKGFGLANVNKAIPVNTDHQFRYYSLSKSITGLALAKLIDLNKLDIERSIRYYLDDLPESYEDVLVKHLINHTAGVRGYNKNEWMKISNQHCTSPSEAMSVFINDPLMSKPGEKYSYTSFGYVLLSQLITELSGQPYTTFVTSQILEPSNIDDIWLDKSSNIINEVQYYKKWNLSNSKGKEANEVNNSCKFGGGGFVGTAQSLVRLYLDVLNHRVISQQTLEVYFNEIETDNNKHTNYAFGIGDAISESGSRYHAHTGSAIGASSALLIYPESKVVVVLLGNLDNNTLNGKIGQISKPFKEVAEKH